jgi:hypothetical protein
MNEPLLRRILGADFDLMPEPVRRMHSLTQNQTVRGTSRVMGGINILAKFMRSVAQLPRPTAHAIITIAFTLHADGEEWDRHFGSSRFHTIMRGEAGHLTEQLAALPVKFIYDVHADAAGFSLHLRGLQFCGVALPRIFWPKMAARARVWQGKYQFSTLVGFWFCGRVISYFGYLDPPEQP